MTSLQASIPRSTLLVMADISTMRCVGCVHMLVGMVLFSMGIVSAASEVYMGWLCVGVWTGISFVSCGVICILTSKSANVFTVAVMACVSVLTLNFACTCAVLTLSSIFPRDSLQKEYSHNQTTATALGILHLVTALIETVTCGASIKIAWRILASVDREGEYRARSHSYDDPYLSSNNYAPISPELHLRRQSSEEDTPPPTYDSATHDLPTSPKTVVGAGPRAARYGSTDGATTTS